MGIGLAGFATRSRTERDGPNPPRGETGTKNQRQGGKLELFYHKIGEDLCSCWLELGFIGVEARGGEERVPINWLIPYFSCRDTISTEIIGAEGLGPTKQYFYF